MNDVKKVALDGLSNDKFWKVFPQRLIYSPLPTDFYKWELFTDFYVSAPSWQGVIPVGFITDLASVPKIFWGIFPPQGFYEEACVAHDWLYSRTVLPRQVCDQVLKEGMEAAGTPWLTTNIIWGMVRLFGWIPYNRHYKKNKLAQGR